VPEKTLEDGFNPVCRTQVPLQPGATAPGSMQDNEISDGRLADALAVDDDRRAGLEEGIADEKLPAAGKLGYEGLQD
jgi:hypothetical protein